MIGKNQMNKPVVLLDCDGVLANFVGAVHTLCTDELDVDFEIPKRYRMFDQFPPDVRARVMAGVGAPGFCRRIKPYAYAPRLIEELNIMGVETYIVTSPNLSCHTWLSERLAWLKQHLGIDPSHVVATSAKHLVHGDVLVEDKFDNAVSWATARDKQAVLVLRSWNAGETHEQVTQVDFLEFVPAIVHRLIYPEINVPVC